MAYRKAAPNGGSSSATREIAALDFLLNIPLEAEQEIVRSGLETEQNLANGGGINHLHHDRSYSIDEEEKLELEKNSSISLLGRNNVRDGISALYRKNNEDGEEEMPWWQSMIQDNKEFFSAEDERIKRREQLELETRELEAPDKSDSLSALDATLQKDSHTLDAQKYLSASLHGGAQLYDDRIVFAPGRRLDGCEATLVKIPREEAELERKTTMRTVVRKAAVRKWEEQMLSSSGNHQDKQCLLDGRIFFSGMSSYPMAVFSVIKYEPEKEAEKRRRKNIEALGGGGSQFVFPSRDWRGISYRALLPRIEKKNKSFNKMIRQGQRKALEKRKVRLNMIKRNNRRIHRRNMEKNEKPNSRILSADSLLSDRSDESNTFSDCSDLSSGDESTGNNLASEMEHEGASDDDSSSSEESVPYYPGFLDDPEMTKGRHRHCMVGDCVTGCVVSSTIQFVSPSDLKADLNKQFRERFDRWEPPKQQQKYIGARVIDGCYTLIDPTEPHQDEIDHRSSEDEGISGRRIRKSSHTDIDTTRMPPSLTLSKIRKIKRQALIACIDCNIEVSTVALACVYFERLALDCRVDKSNRRLTLAACLLIAIKTNEANVALVNEQSNKTSKKGVDIKSWIKMKKDDDVFAGLLEFFTNEWSLSLKTLFAAEFGVFAALNFSLHATPSQVAFHFKRLMKTLEYSSIDYLGPYMYEQWQQCLLDEKVKYDEKERRRIDRQKRKDEKLLKLQQELQIMEVGSDGLLESIYTQVDEDDDTTDMRNETVEENTQLSTLPSKQKGLNDSTEISNETLEENTQLVTLPKKQKGRNILNRIGLVRKSSNSLNYLVSSPIQVQKSRNGDGVIVKDSFDSMSTREQEMRRIKSTPNFKINLE